MRKVLIWGKVLIFGIGGFRILCTCLTDEAGTDDGGLGCRW